MLRLATRDELPSNQPSSSTSAYPAHNITRPATPPPTEPKHSSCEPKVAAFSNLEQAHERVLQINLILSADIAGRSLSLDPGYYSFTADMDNVPSFLKVQAYSRKLTDIPNSAGIKFLCHWGFSFQGDSEADICPLLPNMMSANRDSVSEATLRRHTVLLNLGPLFQPSN